MHYRYACLVCRLFKELEGEYSVYYIEQYHKYYSADEVEVKVNKCGTLCVLVCTDCRKQCGNAGTYILSHDYRQGSAVSNRSRSAHSLQYADRRRRTLNNGCKHSACNNAKHGI